MVSKSKIVEQNLETHTLQEKKVLGKVNFKFILRMYRTFADDSNIYFLLSYVSGMELFDVIRDMDLLDNTQAKFYTGSMILALEYLHTRHIVYRDIKPENVMVDLSGYLKLIDMGTAKILDPEKGVNKTYTILGTPHYMAPEILSGKGYGIYVDLWSLGIMLYELMCGFVPFGEKCEDPYQVYQIITQGLKVQYPDHFLVKKNRAVKAMMEKLISRVPETRLGGSYAALKAHRWFGDFDWDKLHDMKISPPYKPRPKEVLTEEELKYN